MFTAIVGSGSEVGAERPRESVGESEDVRAIRRIEEGQLPCLIVQQDAHPPGRHT